MHDRDFVPIRPKSGATMTQYQVNWSRGTDWAALQALKRKICRLIGNSPTRHRSSDRPGRKQFCLADRHLIVQPIHTRELEQ